MSVTQMLSVPMRYKPWRPRHARLIARDLFGTAPQGIRTHAEHVRAAIDWLCRAQDVRNGMRDEGGVSAGWSFEDGWLPSYPETSGYIIETFVAAAHFLGRPHLLDRAHRIIDWELSIQHEDGAFPGHFGEPGSTPVIFNTGQIMHGMLAGYQLGREECLEAAVRAAHWLARHQDEDGCWRSFEHHGAPHTYNTRATWALLATAVVVGDTGLRRAGVRNLEWALSRQTDSAWFRDNAFRPGESPFTHTIAYAIRGFLECGVLLGSGRHVDAALKAARAVANAQRADGSIAGAFRDGWVADAAYCCLTGVAQMSLDWIRCAQEASAPELRENARRAIAYLKRQQRVDDRDEAVRGALAGSRPIWGRYSRFEFPNWAAKFLADALMMDAGNAPIPAVVAPGVRSEEPIAHV